MSEINTDTISEISDPYFLAYNLYSMAMKNEDMTNGITKALYFSKIYFNADNVILYKMNDDGEYVHTFNSALMNSNSNLTTSVLNAAKAMVQRKQFYQLTPNFQDMNNIAFLRIDVNDSHYVVALTGNNPFKNMDETKTSIFINSMNGILNKYEQINDLSKLSKIDMLTGLGTRNAYEDDTAIKPVHDGMIYAMFDLFRLKNINDNYSHQKGDEYIKKAAQILRNHFPKYIKTVDKTGKIVKSETGTYLYRVGGDEFILISDTESYESAKIKIMIIEDEVRNMDLGVNEVVGINYGLTEAKQDESFRDLYLKSDELLEYNKRANYAALGIERRK